METVSRAQLTQELRLVDESVTSKHAKALTELAYQLRLWKIKYLLISLC